MGLRGSGFDSFMFNVDKKTFEKLRKQMKRQGL